jgi:hypothetical protein
MREAEELMEPWRAASLTGSKSVPGPRARLGCIPDCNRIAESAYGEEQGADPFRRKT